MEPIISDHLTYQDSFRSVTARKLGIDNTPPETAVFNIHIFAIKIFEVLRSLISSAYLPFIFPDDIYRCPALNTAVGGASNSQHLALGGSAAADLDNSIHPNCVQNDSLFMIAYNSLSVDYDQMIAEDIDENGNVGWVHISHDRNKDKQRREAMVSFMINKKRVYRVFDIMKGFIRSKYLQEGEI